MRNKTKFIIIEEFENENIDIRKSKLERLLAELIIESQNDKI